MIGLEIPEAWDLVEEQVLNNENKFTVVVARTEDSQVSVRKIGNQ